MIKSEKKLNELATVINKGNTNLIVNAIEILRDDHPFEGAIGVLTSFYDKTDDYSVKKSIEVFMNDLKDQTACPEVISEIRKELKNETISMLVSSCWQSGLDYSEFAADLALVFLKGDYVTALECLTVIEESAPELSSDKKDQIIKLVKSSPLSSSGTKKSLSIELLSILAEK